MNFIHRSVDRDRTSARLGHIGISAGNAIECGRTATGDDGQREGMQHERKWATEILRRALLRLKVNYEESGKGEHICQVLTGG